MALPGNPLRDRHPTNAELERLRLVLATFKDGSGNLRMPDGTYRPDWRQVERAFAEVFDGQAAESKALFDVDIVPNGGGKPYGLSIKTSLRKADGRVLLELNNSPAKMLAAALEAGLAHEVGGRTEWTCQPPEMGALVVNTVKVWHEAARLSHDLEGSSYVVMTHDRLKNDYEVLRFNLDLGDPDDLTWAERGKAITGTEVMPDGTERVRWEFYATSGGQLKWYPEATAATWQSGIFCLPDASNTSTLLDKAEEMFGSAWPRLEA